MLQSTLLKRLLTKHSCKESIFICDHDTNLECNTLVYTYSDGEYHIYKIKTITPRTIIGNAHGKYEANFNNKMPKKLNWSSIGVFEKGGISDEETVINVNQISGKVLIVNNYLITCCLLYTSPSPRDS